MTGTEDHFRRTLGPDGAAVLVEVIARSVAKAADIGAEMGFTEARTTPTVAYDLAKTALNAEFEDWPGLKLVCRKGQNFWILDDTYALRVKRLGSGYRPSNHDSRQQTVISAQQPFDDLPGLVHVTAGARFSTETGLPIEFVAVKHIPSQTNSHIVEWVVDLRELAQGQEDPSAPILPIEPQAPVAPAARIRRSRKKKETGQVSD